MIIDQLNVIYSNLGMIINLILVIVVPLIVLKLITRAINKFLDNENTNSLNTLTKIIRYVFFLLIFLAILDVLGIDLHSLIVSLGLVSLALTLAAKDTLSNVISGIMILLEKRFVVGDMIEIDGHLGQVKKIGLKSVELYYLKKYTVIPNVLFTTKPFVNHTKNGYYAIKFDITLLNRYDLNDKLLQLEKVLDESELILKDPKYIIRIRSITTHGVELYIKAYVSEPTDSKRITSDLIKTIKEQIEIEDMY